MKFEYAISCGPGTLVDHGEVKEDYDGVWRLISKVDGSQCSLDSELAYLEQKIILIGPVSYEGEGETLKLKGDE